MITHMLVPLDGSDYSEQALEYATGLAKDEGSRVTLLTVIIRYNRSLHQVEKLDEASRQLAMEYLEPLRDRLSQAGIRAEATVVFGAPADAIARAATEAGADLVIMSTHGAGSTGRYALGSIAVKVLQVAPCPVTMIRIQEPSKPKTAL
ncbi:MAG: universal stress protein [Chloroflexi bacterium]|nr:universal stress protein [Chloroflexota bacterium]